jgi:squalene cyclase
MKKAFHLIIKHGGALRINVFTRMYLALLGQVPWRVVPAIPVEIMLLPRWFFFHMDKVSYWAQTIIAPLSIILMKKPVRNIFHERGIEELFHSPPDKLKRLDHLRPAINLKNLFIVFDEFLKRKNGSWFGRWGVNYIYGHGQFCLLLALWALIHLMSYVHPLLCGLSLYRVTMEDVGESCASYDTPDLAGKGESIPSITSWALLGLMAVGEIDSLAVKEGINFLISRFSDKGTWDETLFSGTGFPRFFYLRYTGYSQIFPLWALSVYHT